MCEGAQTRRGWFGPVIHHGTPMTPVAALKSVMPGRSACVSFYRKESAQHVEGICPRIMYDNGAFSFWKQARRKGLEFDEAARDWTPFYRWLEMRLFADGRWAVIPDAPGAPSQLNDALLKEWPFGTKKGAPLWHMNGPISRLGRLCEQYDRVCFGWIGEFDPAIGDIRPEERAVGCDAYCRRMDEVQAFFGNSWHNIHMMRGVAVARDYPFQQRGQHVTRPERMALRRRGRAGRPLFRPRHLGRPQGLRRATGGKARA